MLLTDDPQIARLVQEDSKTEAGLVKWFFVDKMPKISSGHFVRSRLHREDDFICTFVPVEIAIRVATFMNQNVH